MAPDRHSMTELHRSTDDVTGDPIPVDKVAVTDGSGGFTYEDYGAGEDTSLVVIAATGSTETIDCSVARTYDLTLDADCTFTLTGAVNAEAHFLTLLIRENGTGGWSVTWPGSVVWPDGITPVLDESAGAVNTITLLTVDGGTTWYGFPIGGGSIEGSDLEALGVVGPILISDDHSTPIVFADILLTEAGDDILYADVGG